MAAAAVKSNVLLLLISLVVFANVDGSVSRSPPAFNFAIKSTSALETGVGATSSCNAIDTAGFSYTSMSMNVIPTDFNYKGVSFFPTTASAFCYAIVSPNGTVYAFTQSSDLDTVPRNPGGYTTSVALDPSAHSRVSGASVFFISNPDTYGATSTLSIPLVAGTNPSSASTLDLFGDAASRSFVIAFDSRLNPQWGMSATQTPGTATTFTSVTVDSQRGHLFVGGTTQGSQLVLSISTLSVPHTVYATSCLSAQQSTSIYEPFILVLDLSGSVSSIRTLCISSMTPGADASGFAWVFPGVMSLDSAGQLYMAMTMYLQSVTWPGGETLVNPYYIYGGAGGMLAVKVSPTTGNLTYSWVWMFGSDDPGSGLGDTGELVVTPSGDLLLFMTTPAAPTVNVTTFLVDTNMCGSAPAPPRMVQNPSGLLGSLLMKFTNRANSSTAPLGPAWVNQYCNDGTTNVPSLSGIAINTAGTEVYSFSQSIEWNTIGRLNSTGSSTQFTACAGPLFVTGLPAPGSIGGLMCFQKFDVSSGELIWSYGLSAGYRDYPTGSIRALARSVSGSLVVSGVINVGLDAAPGFTTSTLYGPRFNLSYAPYGAWPGVPNSFNITNAQTPAGTSVVFMLNFDDTCSGACVHGTCVNDRFGNFTCS